MFKPEPLTQTVVPGHVGTAVWQNGPNMPDNYLKDSHRNTQKALCLDTNHNVRIKYKKTFSPTASPPPFHIPELRRSRYHYQSRRRPPSYHRVSAEHGKEESPLDEVYLDRRSRSFARYSRKERLPNDAMYYSYYSDEDSTSYFYIDQALPYEQWKEILLRQGSLCEISTSPSLAYATEWLV